MKKFLLISLLVVASVHAEGNRVDFQSVFRRMCYGNMGKVWLLLVVSTAKALPVPNQDIPDQSASLIPYSNDNYAFSLVTKTERVPTESEYSLDCDPVDAKEL